MDIYILTDQKHMMVLDWSSKATFGIWLDKFDYKSVPITTNVVSSNPAHGDAYLM